MHLFLKALTQGFEEDLYEKFDAIFEVGERVAIIGENGVGKTTLLEHACWCSRTS